MSDSWGRPYGVALAGLLALFLFRVLAQMAQAIAPSDALPPFEAWQSGTLPYPVLVVAQVAIIALFTWLITLFWRGGRLGGPRLRTGLWAFGGLYFAGSLLRFIGGFTFARDNNFIGAHLPGFFHIVLASAALLIARYASTAAERATT
ncbi:MAG: hypothetical protein IV086_08065 [Hyphomonadaceae bacterium]|nr:hypothetical protein [Hyphomonadaceae bacterium]